MFTVLGLSLLALAWAFVAMLVVATGVVIAFLGVSAAQWWRLRFGGAAVLPAVVRGTSPGLYAEAMPGALHLTGAGVWWVPEGTREPISLQGRVDVDPLTDADVPKELTCGVMRSPTTLRVHLDAGGCADLTLPCAGVRPSLAALTRMPAGGPPFRAPRRCVRAPIGRLARPCLGLLLMAGAGLAMAAAVPSRGAAWAPATAAAWMVAVGLAVLVNLGGDQLCSGVSRLRRRRELVRLNRGSRNEFGTSTRQPIAGRGVS